MIFLENQFILYFQFSCLLTIREFFTYIWTSPAVGDFHLSAVATTALNCSEVTRKQYCFSTTEMFLHVVPYSPEILFEAKMNPCLSKVYTTARVYTFEDYVSESCTPTVLSLKKKPPATNLLVTAFDMINIRRYTFGR